jgi:hypothetical protein
VFPGIKHMTSLSNDNNCTTASGLPFMIKTASLIENVGTKCRSAP